MQKSLKRFRLQRFSFETYSGKIINRYMITDNLIPMLEVNQWVEAKSLRKTSTGKEYAGKLVVYLNYLDEVGVEYHVATNKNVKGFIHNLIYGGLQDLKIKSLEAAVFYPTLSKYVTVITELYKWLDNNYETSITFQTKTDSIRAKKSFLYGQIYSYDYKYIVDRYLPSLKGGREYIKWYEDGEKAALCSNFSTLRDEAVFRVTLEGFRIDEVLSMRLGNYNPVEQVIQPSRSKGRQDVRTGTFNHLRTVALPAVTCEVLNKYIQTERMIAENQSGIISNFIFLNTQKDTNQGKPLSYSNYYKIFKRCAVRAGINPDKVRTHSGRSTKVMEFIEHQILHPEDGITDAIIMESFGWRNDGSIASYRNHNNQVIAKEIMRKLHKKKPLCNGGSSND